MLLIYINALIAIWYMGQFSRRAWRLVYHHYNRASVCHQFLQYFILFNSCFNFIDGSSRLVKDSTYTRQKTLILIHEQTEGRNQVRLRSCPTFHYTYISMKQLNYLEEFSLWHLARALHRFGSGHRSRGVCPFLFFMFRSAPLAAKKHAIEAEDFLSAP